MARERRGAGSSVVSIETRYYKTIYQRCIIGRRDKHLQDNILQVQDTSLHRILRTVFHTQNLLHTGAFAQKLSHTGAFTHRDFYTQTLLHTDAFTHRSFYTQKVLHTEGFTHKH